MTGLRVAVSLGAVVVASCARPSTHDLATDEAGEVAVEASPLPTRATDAPSPPPSSAGSTALAEAPLAPSWSRGRVVETFGGRKPRAWGQDLEGVRASAPASGKRDIALTFDACGGHGGDGYDEDLIAFLRREKVPATLFFTARWIETHPTIARDLARDPLFEIEDHGTAHRPCSVSGRAAYHIRGTRNAGEAFDEITGGRDAIVDLGAPLPRFYRPATGFFDDVCVDIARALALVPVGFAVNGDGGSGYSREDVRHAITSAPSGAVVLLHMNHPRGQTAEGVRDAVTELSRRGVSFVLLRQMFPASER